MKYAVESQRPKYINTIGKNLHSKGNKLATLYKINSVLESRNFELREQIRQLLFQTAAAEPQREQYKRKIKIAQ